jgi:hypothetical protein
MGRSEKGFAFGFRSIGRRRAGGFFLELAQLVFKLHHADVEAFQDFAHIGGKDDTVRAMMPRGVAALDGIFEFFPAGAAGAGALAGGDFFHGREFNSKSKARNPLPIQVMFYFGL